MRQRLTAASGAAKAGSADFRLRRKAKATTPEPSAASCSRREAVRSSRPDLPHHAGKAGMTQPLLHREQHTVPSRDMQDAAMAEPDAGQAPRAKRSRRSAAQITVPDGCARGCRPPIRAAALAMLLPPGPGIGDLVQTAEGEAASGQVVVDFLQAEGQIPAVGGLRVLPLQPRDGLTQLRQRMRRREGIHMRCS